MYYKAKIKEKIEDDKGKIRKQIVEYLVDAESVTEVEAVMAKEYFGVTFDWELVSASKTTVVKVLSGSDRAD